MKFYVDFNHQYAPLFQRGKHWNWIDFTIIYVGFEYASYSSRFEINVGLLGLGLDLMWVWHPSDKGPNAPENKQ